MRKIDDKLIDRLTKGDLLPLLNYIKSDNELRLEVRQNSGAFVYYRKGKALEIKKLKVDTKYGNVPNTDLAVSNPKEYFKLIKNAIDNWLGSKKQRAEFDLQQKIAKSNQDKSDKYIILDMEYDFENYLFGNNAKTFKSNLVKDIKNIIDDKIKLGIIDNFSFSDAFEMQNPELVFIFHPDTNSQIQEFSNELKNRHKLIVVSDNNYKLK